MSGNLDDLEFGLGVDLAESLKGLRQVVSSLDQVQANIGALVPAYNDLNAATMRLATAGSLPVRNAELLMAGMGSIGNTIERLDGQMQRMDTRLETAVMASTDLSEHWQYINRDVRASTDTMRQFAEQSRAAAQAVQTIVVDTASNRMTPKQPTQKLSGFDMVKMASAALAVKAVGSVSNAMTTARTAIASIDTTTRTAVLSLDRFRMGLAAPAVNPNLNTLPGLIQKISGGVAGAVESFRGFGDATIAGAPAIMTAIAGGMQKVLGSGDSLQATVSKITSQLDIHRGALDRVAAIYPTTGTAVGMLKDAMNFIAPAAEKVAQTVDAANASVRDAAISARNLAFVATGAFIKTGTSADLYARGAYHALLPTRLMAFEAKFAAGSMGLVRRAFAVVTSPIHAVQMGLQRSAGEFRELRANLPPLTGNLRGVIAQMRSGEITGFANRVRAIGGALQVGVRAMRAFSHVTLGASQAIATVRTAIRPVTFVASSLWNLVRPARAAKVGLDGVAVGGHKAGIALRAVSSMTSTAASGLRSVAGAGGRAASSLGGGWISGIASTAGMASMALAGLGIAAAGMAGSTAMAVEKNQAVFGVMLKDMDQGKAVVASLQGSQAVGLFDNDEVLNSGRLLFKAGVAAVDLSAKTDQLATIAAATSTELGDLTRIYQQGANRGSFGQDKINQMAERGIDIYHALEAVTGKSGAALSDMISGGKIGITEMDAALAHLTTGNGIYAGSLETLGGTTSGMLAQIKNNLVQALGGIGGVGLEAFKPILAGVLTVSEGIKTSISAVAPIVTLGIGAVTSFLKASFNIWSNAASTTFRMILGESQISLSGIMESAAALLGAVTFAFDNIGLMGEYAFKRMQLFGVTAFNVIGHFFGVQVPEYLTWFGANWTNVFSDMGMIYITFFDNLQTNIIMVMGEVWDFIKSGGTDAMEFTWTPLLDGFKATIGELPNIAAREMSDLEKSLTVNTEALAQNIGDGMGAAMAQATLTLTPPMMPEIDPTLQSGGMNDGQGESAGNKRTNFAVSGLERGSEAALNAIFNAQKDKVPSQQLAEQKKTNGHLAKIANKPQPAMLGGV